jgi:hypothetical protein
MPRFDQPIESMTLGNMRELDVRSFHMSCWNCHHQAVLSADRPDDVAVPSLEDPDPGECGAGIDAKAKFSAGGQPRQSA